MNIFFKIALTCLGVSLISGLAYNITDNIFVIPDLIDIIEYALFIICLVAAIVLAAIGLWN